MDPNSPINQQPSATPQSVITSQPLTQSGLPSQTTTFVSSSKKSSKKWLIIFLVVLVILLVGGGGVYILFTRSTKTENKSTNIIVPSSTPATSAATGSTELLDTTDWLTYDSPCISFKYEKGWNKSSESVKTTHVVVKGQDTYGSTVLGWNKADSDNQSFNFLFSCLPNGLINSSFQKILDNDKADFKPEDNIPGDIIKQSKIDGMDIDRVLKGAYSTKSGGFRIGTLSINGVKGNYYLTTTLSWPYEMGNDAHHQIRREYETMLSTMKIKDIFTK